jgi:DNA polymerase I
MLVTCFGYTGYKTAKFGRIEVHEGITGKSRDILLQTKDIAEQMGFTVLHGIVDCLWIQGSPIDQLKVRVEHETGLLSEVEHFDWIVFEPLNDGLGAYNRYFGRLSDGSIKVRGIAARRHDTTEFVRNMQNRILDCMARVKTVKELESQKTELKKIYLETIESLPSADPKTLAITRRISKLQYSHRCLEGAAIEAYERQGIELAPGMKIQYVVRDARRYQVEPLWSASSIDVAFYRSLVDKAWEEVSFAIARTNNIKTTELSINSN